MRVLVYDDACTMCVRKSRSIVAWAKVGDAGRRPLSSYEGELAGRLEAAGARNEMAVLDEATGEIESGYDGIVSWLRGTRGGFVVRCLAFAPVRVVGRIVYRVISYNRRIVAPTRHAIRCACDPDPSPLYNGLFAFVLLAVAAAGVFVVATFVDARESPWFAGRARALLAVAAPVGVAGLLAAASRSGARWAAAMHALWMLGAATLPWLVVAAVGVRAFARIFQEIERASVRGWYGAPPEGLPMLVWLPTLFASLALLVFEYRRRAPHLPVGGASRARPS